MILKDIYDFLREHQDEKYAEFLRKLLPNVKPEQIIGVRTPLLRKYVKQIKNSDICEPFLKECPHSYFEENQIHGFLISEEKDFEKCMEKLESFLPHMDNWATCDQTSPKIFKAEKERLLPHIEQWLASSHVYTIRFGTNMLMQHFLDNDFKPQYLDMAVAVKSEEYYVNMGIAWYMATALAKQWDAAIPYITSGKMGKWVHNRTIQKAIESRRISPEQKNFLKQFRVP
jgi:3-methyladenine DNA glycosylase AlkD